MARIELGDLLEHQGWMRSLARTLVNDDATVDDVVQDAWAAAIQQPPRSQDSVRGWLATVVRNLSYRTHRDRERRRRREQGVAMPEVGPTEGGTADRLTEKLELQRRVIDVVLSLDDRYRNVVFLRYYEELSSAEIARRLDVPAATIRTRLKRGLDELRGRLDSEFGDRRSWGLALLPLADLRPSSVSISASGAAAAGSWRTLTPAWIGIGTVIMSTKKAAALLVLAVALAMGIHLGMNGSESPSPSTAPSDSFVAKPTISPTPSTEASSPRVPEPEADASSDPQTTRSANGLRVQGRVVDAFDRAIAGASLTPPGEFDPVITDLDGRFIFELERFGRRGSYELTVAADGFARTYPSVWVEPGADIDMGSIRLDEGGSITGRVVDEHGLAVPAAALEVEIPDRLGAIEGTADETGSFRFEGLPLGYVGVRALHRDQRSDLVNTVVEADRKPPALEVQLRPRDISNLVRGVVLDVDGEPVPFANVSASFAGGVTGAAADASGEFSFSARIGAKVSVIARPRVVVSTRHGVDEKSRRVAAMDGLYPGGDPVVLRLDDPEIVEIWTVDSAGESVAINSLDEFRAHAGGRSSWSAQVEVLEGVGHYRLFLAPHESWIAFRSTRHLDVEIGPFIPGRAPESLTVVMEPFPSIQVRVSNGAGPVSGAAVTVHELHEASVRHETNGFTEFFGKATNQAVTDDEGAAELSIDLEGVRSEDTPWFVLRATADGFAPARSQPIALGELRRLDVVDLTLTLGGAIEGRLSLPDGRNPAGAYVAASCGDGEILHVNVTRDGAFLFERLAPGPWQVREYFSEFLTTRVGTGFRGENWLCSVRPEWNCEVIEGEVTRFDLDLRDRSAFTLSGSVNFDGDAPGPWTAKLRPVVEIDSLTEHYYRPQKLDPTGAFQCTAPHLGLHRLTISGTLADGTEVWMRDQLELSSGDHEWSFAVDLVSIAGTFEAAGGILRYQRGVGDRVLFITLRRDDDGTFSGRVPVGAGSITFRPAGGKSRVLRTLDVPSGGRVGIELSK